MTLLEILRSRGCLLAGEDQALLSPDVRDLAPEAQLKFLRDNRAVGRFVTGFAGGIRLLLLGGGALGLVATMISGETPLAWWSVAIAIGLVGTVVWLTPAFFVRMRELGRPLPEWREIERELAKR